MDVIQVEPPGFLAWHVALVAAAPALLAVAAGLAAAIVPPGRGRWILAWSGLFAALALAALALIPGGAAAAFAGTPVAHGWMRLGPVAGWASLAAGAIAAWAFRPIATNQTPGQALETGETGHRESGSSAASSGGARRTMLWGMLVAAALLLPITVAPPLLLLASGSSGNRRWAVITVACAATVVAWWLPVPAMLIGLALCLALCRSRPWALVLIAGLAGHGASAASS
ncbi:hypothetical protein LBMAG53_10950 [Planctomycetota bacterium]|nr:hypothetical protein LBMAG53_10950 [Planctomycetota bacterium]